MFIVCCCAGLPRLAGFGLRDYASNVQNWFDAVIVFTSFLEIGMGGAFFLIALYGVLLGSLHSFVAAAGSRVDVLVGSSLSCTHRRFGCVSR